MHQGTILWLALCKIVLKCPTFLIITHILQKDHAQILYSEGLIQTRGLLLMAVSFQGKEETLLLSCVS